MTATTEQAPKATQGRQRKPRKPEAPNDSKTRWMLWMPDDLLAALAAEKKRSGLPMAQIVVQAAEAVMALPADVRDAYASEAKRQGVTVPEVYRAALSEGTARHK